MNDLRAAAQQALEALENGRRVRACEGGTKYQPPLEEAAITALKTALEQQEQEQEPVAWIQPDHLQKARQAPFLCRVEPTQRMSDFVPIYTTPPRREPEPPPEPISDAKIRAEFLDINRHTLPGETAAEDWFEAGVRFAERQHEIV